MFKILSYLLKYENLYGINFETGFQNLKQLFPFKKPSLILNFFVALSEKGPFWFLFLQTILPNTSFVFKKWKAVFKFFTKRELNFVNYDSCFMFYYESPYFF